MDTEAGGKVENSAETLRNWSFQNERMKLYGLSKNDEMNSGHPIVFMIHFSACSDSCSVTLIDVKNMR